MAQGPEPAKAAPAAATFNLFSTLQEIFLEVLISCRQFPFPMRNISFSLTTAQVRAQTKDVTRRLGWWFLKPGDVLQPIEKGRGLKKGQHVTKIGGPIRVISTRREELCRMKRADLAREGFPEMRFKHQFVLMFCEHNKCEPTTEVNRIEFEYL